MDSNISHLSLSSGPKNRRLNCKSVESPGTISRLSTIRKARRAARKPIAEVIREKNPKAKRQAQFTQTEPQKEASPIRPSTSQKNGSNFVASSTVSSSNDDDKSYLPSSSSRNQQDNTLTIPSYDEESYSPPSPTYWSWIPTYSPRYTPSSSSLDYERNLFGTLDYEYESHSPSTSSDQQVSYYSPSSPNFSQFKTDTEQKNDSPASPICDQQLSYSPSCPCNRDEYPSHPRTDDEQSY